MSLAPLFVFAVVGTIIGIIIFVAGSMLVRAGAPEQLAAGTAQSAVGQSRGVDTKIRWTRAITGDDAAVNHELRADMLERLAIVGQSWCADILAQAAAEERDDALRDMAERALLVVRARPA